MIENALLLLALRETAWHLLHYGPSAALTFLRHQFAQFKHVADACSGLMDALTEDDGPTSDGNVRPGAVASARDHESWIHLERFAAACVAEGAAGVVVLDASAFEQAFTALSQAACVPAQLQVESASDSCSAKQVRRRHGCG